ncbi:MmyB family transcriptional regulator [Actinomadura physcomitrii]|uniref:MmyB family transcriptional regulator n=1 Tax=Actinomadura physcomitrii TaxID=2650748 RepID=UPI00136D8E8C|nr:hypothetical protein [Actinomadura physcomitrii]
MDAAAEPVAAAVAAIVAAVAAARIAARRTARIRPVEALGDAALALVADLRAVAGRRSGDPDVTGLVERLSAESADFRRHWAEHRVAVRRLDRKTLLHPRVGRLLMDCEILLTPDLSRKLVVLAHADADTRERLDLLRVIGTEEFATGAPDAPASWEGEVWTDRHAGSTLFSITLGPAAERRSMVS